VYTACGNCGDIGPGVKHLARIASRPVTWVIKIKHAGLGVLDQATSDLAPPEMAERQATSAKPQA